MVQHQQRHRTERSAARSVRRGASALVAAMVLLASQPACAVTPAVAQPVANGASASTAAMATKSVEPESGGIVSPGVTLLLAALAVALYLGSRGSRD